MPRKTEIQRLYDGVLPPRPEHATDAQWDDFVAHVRDGRSYTDIAAERGVSISRIRQRVHDLDWKVSRERENISKYRRGDTRILAAVWDDASEFPVWIDTGLRGWRRGSDLALEVRDGATAEGIVHDVIEAVRRAAEVRESEDLEEA